jgi:hypothetical protein
MNPTSDVASLVVDGSANRGRILLIIVLLAVFHRPLFFEGTRYFIVRAAKRQHLDLSYDISGSILATLTVSNLRGIPEQGPIQRLEVGTLITLQFDRIHPRRLAGFAQADRSARRLYRTHPGEPLRQTRKRNHSSSSFRRFFRKPNVENVNFISHGPNGDTELAGFFLSLLPDRPGELKIQTLDIPGVAVGPIFQVPRPFATGI